VENSYADPPLTKGMEKSKEDLIGLVGHQRCGPRLSLTKVINLAVELRRKDSLFVKVMGDKMFSTCPHLVQHVFGHR